jgi:two-component system, LuxR family, response regulator FixJ
MIDDQAATAFIVDDDEMVRDSLRALLEAHRFRVHDFESARDFLHDREALARSCLLADMHMPGMNGVELLQVLRQAGDATPVVLYTGRKDPTLEARALAEGASAVLDKPVTHTTLLAAIRCALGSRNR